MEGYSFFFTPQSGVGLRREFRAEQIYMDLIQPTLNNNLFAN
jgi:hypothetical protein